MRSSLPRRTTPRFADASTDSALWWASEIAAGKTTVWPGSRELFVPQAVNYELSGGVVFNKGCYPGQEVVSRVQHIGETSRPRPPSASWPAPRPRSPALPYTATAPKPAS